MNTEGLIAVDSSQFRIHVARNTPVDELPTVFFERDTAVDQPDMNLLMIFDLGAEAILSLRAVMDKKHIVYDHAQAKHMDVIAGVTNAIAAVREFELQHPGQFPSELKPSYLLVRSLMYRNSPEKIVKSAKREEQMKLRLPDVRKELSDAYTLFAEYAGYPDLLDLMELKGFMREPERVMNQIKNAFHGIRFQEGLTPRLQVLK